MSSFWVESIEKGRSLPSKIMVFGTTLPISSTSGWEGAIVHVFSNFFVSSSSYYYSDLALRLRVSIREEQELFKLSTFDEKVKVVCGFND